MSIGKIESVRWAGPPRIAVAWDDGTRSEIDLAPLLATRPQLAVIARGDSMPQCSEDGWSVEFLPSGIDFGAAQLRRWANEQSGEAMPAAAFRAWMQGHGFTLDRAAEALGLSRRTVAYYLSGEQPVPKTVMLATEGYDNRQAA
jgi:hypothetical protein